MYELLSIEPGKDRDSSIEIRNIFQSHVHSRCIDFVEDTPSGYEDIFKIENLNNQYGVITTTKSLRGYSGRWKIEIRAYDRGDEGNSRISLSSTAVYYVNINAMNFFDPEIIFPRNDATIRLE